MFDLQILRKIQKLFPRNNEKSKIKNTSRVISSCSPRLRFMIGFQCSVKSPAFTKVNKLWLSSKFFKIVTWTADIGCRRFSLQFHRQLIQLGANTLHYCTIFIKDNCPNIVSHLYLHKPTRWVEIENWLKDNFHANYWK